MKKQIFLFILMTFFLIILIQGATDFTPFIRYEFQHGSAFTEPGPKAAECVSQSFKIGTVGTNETLTLKGISVNMKRDGSPGSIVNFSIFNTNSTTGLPLGPRLDHNSTDGLITAAALTWVNITMPGDIVLVKGGNYSIQVVSQGAGDGANKYEWGQDRTNPYAGGVEGFSSNACSTFVVTGANDQAFEIYGLPQSPSVTLNIPINDSLKINPVTFNCSSIGTAIANISLWIDDVLNITITGSGSAISLQQQRNLTLANHEWTCSSGSTGGTSFASANFTLLVGEWEENNQIFNPNTFEGNTETFKINITAISGLQVSTGVLHYNNTEFLGSISSIGPDEEGDQFIISRTLAVPNLTASANLTFFWEIDLNSGFTANSSSNNQSVSVISIDDCGSNSLMILNFTYKDEDDLTGIPAATNNTIIEIDVDLFATGTTTNPIAEFSQNYTQINPARVCLANDLNNTSYDMDVDIRYDADNYANEFYHIQKFVLSKATSSQNISLFGLLDSRAQKFVITFKDITFIPIEGALIDVTRKYIAEGLFRTVEIGETDSTGQTVAQLVISETIYTFIVSKDGQTLATFENIKAICSDATIGDCQINLNALSTSTPVEDFTTVGGLSFTMVFDEALRRITSVFSTLDGSTSLVQLNATKFDRFGNDTVCSDFLSSSSGTLTCTIPASFGNGTVIARLFNNNELVVQRTYILSIDPVETFDYNSAFMVIILAMTIPLMFITSGVGVIFGAIIGFIIAISLSIYSGFSLIGSTSSILWLIIAGAILIWKISQIGKA